MDDDVVIALRQIVAAAVQPTGLVPIPVVYIPQLTRSALRVQPSLYTVIECRLNLRIGQRLGYKLE